MIRPSGQIKILAALILFTAIQSSAQMQSLGSKDAFRTANLSRRETAEILKQVEASAYDYPEDWTSELRVRRVDLGGSPGLVLQGSKLLCGVTGNCQTWVFRKANDKWLSLFSADAPVAEGFRLGPGITGGIKDLTIVANSSAEAGRSVAFKFDGRFYRRK